MNQVEVTIRKWQLICTATGECLDQATMSDLEASLLNAKYHRLGVVVRWQEVVTRQSGTGKELRIMKYTIHERLTNLHNQFTFQQSKALHKKEYKLFNMYTKLAALVWTKLYHLGSFQQRRDK